MGFIDLELSWNSTTIKNKLVSYRRDNNICTSVGLMEFTVKLSNVDDYNYWDEVIPYEDGRKAGEFFISEILRSVPNGLVTIRCQNMSKRMMDYFVDVQYETTEGDYVRPWVEQILNDAGISYEFNTDDQGVQLPEYKIGFGTCYELVMNLIANCGWFMYFDTESILHIGELNKDTGSAASFDDTDIVNISYEENDSMLRTRAVIYGTDVYTEQTIDSTYTYDSDDVRTVVVANPYIRDIGVANEEASKLLNEFSDIERVKEVTVKGFHDVEVGQNVTISSSVYSGTGMVTIYEVQMSDKGVLSIYTVDKRCPRLFGYWSPYYLPPTTEYNGILFISTWGNGVWQKPPWSNTWTDFSTGLTDLYIQDLYVKNGLLVCVSDNGFAYYRTPDYTAWFRIWHGDLLDNEGKSYPEDKIKARACVINDKNELIVGYNHKTSLISWVCAYDGLGNNIYQNFVSTSGSDLHYLYDIDHYANGNLVTTCSYSGISPSGLFPLSRNNNHIQGNMTRYCMYDHRILTVLPYDASGGLVNIIEDVDFSVDGIITRNCILCYDDYSLSYPGVPNDLISVNYYGPMWYLEHYIATTSGLMSFYTKDIGIYPNDHSFVEYFGGDSYYILITPDGALLDSSTYYHVTVIGDVVDSNEYPLGTPFPLTNMDHVNSTKVGQYIYIAAFGTDAGEPAAYVEVKQINIITGVCTSNTFYFGEKSYNPTTAPIMPVGETGYVLIGSYLKLEEKEEEGDPGYPLSVYGFMIVNGALLLNKRVTGASGQVVGYGVDPMFINADYIYGMITSINNDGGYTLMAINGYYGPLINNDGETVAYNGHYFIYYDPDYGPGESILDGGEIASTWEWPGGVPVEPTYRYTFNPINTISRCVPINSRHIARDDRCFAQIDEDHPYKIRFYNPRRRLLKVIDVRSYGYDEVTGISSNVDDYDFTLYVRALKDSDSRMLGISIDTWQLNKKFIGFYIPGDLGETFNTFANCVVGGNELRFLYDYIMPSGVAADFNVLNHTNSSFGKVLDTDHASKVEISKQTPAIVYNVAQEPNMSDVYVGDLAAASGVSMSGIWQEFKNFARIHCVRIYDANYFATPYETYNRYMLYSTPSGVYTLNTLSIGGTPSQVQFSGMVSFDVFPSGYIPPGYIPSGVAPSGGFWMLETSNYGIWPYMFVNVSGPPQQFYQRNPETYIWLNHSIALPAGFITQIRMDDMY